MKISKELFGTLNALGQEIMDPEPAFVTVGGVAESIHDQIKRLLRVELSRQAATQGFETFEESDDFEEDEVDDAPPSVYQDERLMRPDWPGPQKGMPKKSGDEDLEPVEAKRPEAAQAGDEEEETPPKKPAPKPKKKAGTV